LLLPFLVKVLLFFKPTNFDFGPLCSWFCLTHLWHLIEFSLNFISIYKLFATLIFQNLRSNKWIGFADQIEAMYKVVIDNDKPQDLFVHIRNFSF
jgi:hypothetical protein